MTLTASGLAVVGLTATSEGPQRYSLAALMAVESAILAPGVGLVRIATHRDVKHLGEALLLATALACCSGSPRSRSSTHTPSPRSTPVEVRARTDASVIVAEARAQPN